MHNFSSLFWNSTLHVSDGHSVHHQVSKTVHTASGICHTLLMICSASENLLHVILHTTSTTTVPSCLLPFPIPIKSLLVNPSLLDFNKSMSRYFLYSEIHTRTTGQNKLP